MESAELFLDIAFQNYDHTELLVIALNQAVLSFLHIYWQFLPQVGSSNTWLLTHVKSNQDTHRMRNGFEDIQTHIHLIYFG